MNVYENIPESRMMADLVLSEMPCDMIICLYALYNYNEFREKRIKRIAEAVRAEVEDILVKERLPEIQRHLKKCRIDAGSDGKISVIKKERTK